VPGKYPEHKRKADLDAKCRSAPHSGLHVFLPSNSKKIMTKDITKVELKKWKYLLCRRY